MMVDNKYPNKYVLPAIVVVVLGLFLFAFRDKLVKARVSSSTDIPASIHPVLNYWDRFNTVTGSDSALTDQMFIQYIGLLQQVPDSLAFQSLRKMVYKYEKDSRTLGQLLDFSERYFFDPNSPVRNEAFYLSVLESTLSTGGLDLSRNIRLDYQLTLLKKNMVSAISTNFTITIADGPPFQLHDIKAEYLILLFSDPECHACKVLIEDLEKSEVINYLLTQNPNGIAGLKLLNLYTGSDLPLWFESSKVYPNVWLNGYDNGQLIKRGQAYDLKALPTLYLLDRNKKILLKDVTFELLEANLSQVLNVYK